MRAGYLASSRKSHWRQLSRSGAKWKRRTWRSSKQLFPCSRCRCLPTSVSHNLPCCLYIYIHVCEGCSQREEVRRTCLCSWFRLRLCCFSVCAPRLRLGCASICQSVNLSIYRADADHQGDLFYQSNSWTPDYSGMPVAYDWAVANGPPMPTRDLRPEIGLDRAVDLAAAADLAAVWWHLPCERATVV